MIFFSGPSSDCGASGRANVIAEDGVQFFFRNSRMSNNGTDVNVGQIPELLYVSEVNAAPSASIANRDDSPEYVDARYRLCPSVPVICLIILYDLQV